MWIRYTDGRTRAGILMAVSGNALRVAIHNEDDITEFTLVNGRWISEDCEPVTFEFPLAAFQAAGIVPEMLEPELPISLAGEDCELELVVPTIN